MDSVVHDYMELKTKYEGLGTPFYLPLEGRLLIGTNHTQRVTKDSARTLQKKIEGFDHLIIEGTRNDLTAGIQHSLQLGLLPNYEQCSYVFSKGEKHFLEEGVKLGELAARHGFREDLYGLYYLFMFQERLILQRKRLGQTFYQTARGHLERDVTMNGESIDTDLTIDRHRRLLLEFKIDPRLLSGAGNLFAWYTGRLRDFEYIGPGIKQLDSGLEGSKAVISGIAHLEAIEKTLRGKTLDNPPNWNEFVKSLPQEQREFLQKLENNIFPL